MTIKEQKPSARPGTKTLSFLVPVLFFTSYFFFVLLYIDPRVVDSFNGVHKYSYIIELTRGYAGTILSVPGGPDRFCSSIIVLACRYPWLGALLFTVLAWALYATGAIFVRQCTGRAPHIVQYAQPLLLLAILGRYNMHYLPAVLADLGIVFLAVCFQRLTSLSTIKRCVAYLALFFISYYLFSFNAILFGVLVCTDEPIARKKTALPLLVATAGAALALFTARAFLFPFDRIFNYATILDVKRPLVYLYASVPLSSLLYGLTNIWFSRRKAMAKSHSHSVMAVIFSVGRECVVPIALAAVMTWTCRDMTTRIVRELGQVLYYDRTCQWPEILKKRSSFIFDLFPQYQSRTVLLTTHAMYRALYHTGRLGSDMFSFPQTTDPEPLMLRKTVWSVYFPAWAAALDIGIDLGAVSYSERVAGEAMENMGPHPFLLYRRALLQAAKGNNELAMAYLNVLRTMPGFGDRAELLLRQLNGPDHQTDTTISRLHACMDREDYIFNRVDEETMLKNLMSANPHNKMAFEYLMAYYLLTRQPDKVAKNLYRLDDFDYQAIPVLYEEALEIYLNSDSLATAIKPKLILRPQTVLRCLQFLKTLNLYSSGTAGAETALRSDFGTSYFYFYTFGFSGGGKR